MVKRGREDRGQSMSPTAKTVDIALATDKLTQAHRDNWS
jgi:hypothetical protein